MVACLAAAWWVPALLPGSVLPPTNGLTAFGLVAWWVAFGVIGAAVAGPNAATGLWLGTIAATLVGSAAVAVTGAAAPGWLDWAGHALAIMALAFLAGIPAARALARAGARRIDPARHGQPGHRRLRRNDPLLRRALALLPGTACLVPPILLTSPNDQVLGTISCAVIGAVAGYQGMVGLPALWLGAAVLPLLSAISYAAGVGLPGPNGMPIEFALGLVGFVLVAATPGHIAGDLARRRLRGPRAVQAPASSPGGRERDVTLEESAGMR